MLLLFARPGLRNQLRARKEKGEEEKRGLTLLYFGALICRFCCVCGPGRKRDFTATARRSLATVDYTDR